MKIRHKILLYSLSVCFLAISAFGVLQIETNYQQMLEREIRYALHEESNIRKSFFLQYHDLNTDSDLINPVPEGIKKLCFQYLINGFFIEVFSPKKEIIYPENAQFAEIKRKELDDVFEGERTYILRKIEKRHLLFVTNAVNFSNQRYAVAAIRDISFLPKIRNRQYITLLYLEAAAFLILFLVFLIVSRSLTKSLDRLLIAICKVTNGDYHTSVCVKGEYEIKELSKQFNLMISEIDRKIQIIKNKSDQQERFIASFTHELRTPLTSIIGFADLITTRDPDKAITIKSAQKIYKEGKRLLQLGESLRDIILLNKGLFDKKKCNLKDFTHELIGLVSPVLHGKNILIEIKGSGFIVAINKELFISSCLNIIDNAVKASSEGGKIIIGTEILNNKAILYIQDFGSGIPPNELGKITEPFYRIDISRSSNMPGFGLGLSIANEIIKLHNADLEISSKEGNGTKISIIFDFFEN